MARLSLLLASLSMLSGCLVADPPPYTPPTQTPPRLDQQGADPPIDQILVTAPGSEVLFSMPVRSEDVGDKVTGFLLLDYQGGGEDSADILGDLGVEIEASTLDDKARTLVFQRRLSSKLEGCHRITLRVSHSPNFKHTAIPHVFDEDDVAEAYWWLNIIDPQSGNNGSTLVGCPFATVVQP